MTNSAVPDEEIRALGIRIDTALDTSDEAALNGALVEVEGLLEKGLTDVQRGTLYYFAANIWDGKRLATRGGSALEQWDQPELEQEILLLRKALQLGRDTLQDEMLCQVLTNLANCLNHVGRPVEALDYWGQALDLIPDFPMARGNNGAGLTYFAKLLHDPGHQSFVLHQAHRDLARALEFRGCLHPGATRYFERHKARIETYLRPEFLVEELGLDRHSIGQDAVEAAYRRWVLENRLFLNPLNELGAHSIAAADVMMLPNMTVNLSEGPVYIGFFNQMKQEFVSARYMFYEGLIIDEPHFSDRHVTLMNTLDYPVYSLGIERMKAGFRTAYAIFDKIAFFLNHYLALGLPDRRISFKTIWFEKAERTKGLNSAIQALNNNVLRGLYWLSKDLAENREGFVDALEPEAQNIEFLRQVVEHRYLKVHEHASAILAPDDPLHEGFADTLAESIGRSEFEEKALVMFGMARAALIYLSAAVFVEEERRSTERGKDSLVIPMALDTWEDEWKV